MQPTDNSMPLQEDRFRPALATLGGLFLLVWGAKLLLIQVYGNPTPFWDQWDAEAAALYKPYVEGTLTWNAMFAPHNEHRIVVTRLLGLALLETAGEWDPLLEMVVNAALHAGFAALFTWFFLPSLAPRDGLALALVAAIAFSVPIGWENTLAGFQSQFYFLLLFSALALRLFVDAQPFDRRWWLALALSLCAYFSLASGALTVIAAAAIVTVQILCGARARGPRQIAGVAVLAAAAALMLAFSTHVPQHDGLKAQSAGDLLRALADIAKTPASFRLGIVLHLPLVWLAVVVLRDAKRAGWRQWLVLALAGWVALQMASLAYGRAPIAMSSRYMDIFLILLPLDFAALLWLTGRREARMPVLRYAPAAWFALLSVGLAVAAPESAFEQAAERGAVTAIQEANTRAFLATGDIAALAGKPHMHIPYPDPARLAALLSDPTIRALLPQDIRPADADVTAIQARLLTGGHFVRLALGPKRRLIDHAPVIFALGAALLFAAAFRRRDPSRAPLA